LKSNYCLDTEKDKSKTFKRKCLEQITRSATVFSGRKVLTSRRSKIKQGTPVSAPTQINIDKSTYQGKYCTESTSATDRHIPSSIRDTIIRNNEKQTCMLIDVGVSESRNVTTKGVEKDLKYKDLTI
jgi:hypothetical protein